MRDFLNSIRGAIINNLPQKIECNIDFSYLVLIQDVLKKLKYHPDSITNTVFLAPAKTHSGVVRFYDLAHLDQVFDDLAKDWMSAIDDKVPSQNFIFLTKTFNEHFFASNFYFLDNFKAIILPESLE